MWNILLNQTGASNWKTRVEQAFPESGHQTAQEEEMRCLKRELEVIRQERDIL